MSEERRQCADTVLHRDTYRYSGRGSSGFTMYYNKARCSRFALPGKSYCWQHTWSGDDTPEVLAAREAERDAVRRKEWDERTTVPPA
jgi:hypothetical protein